ncbi:MAG: CHASE2 domain-containing protein [Pseudomonadota bacterium]
MPTPDSGTDDETQVAFSRWCERLGLRRFTPRMALRDWLILLLALLVLALVLGWQNGLGRIDQGIYDKLLSATSQPHRDDIIIIAIDDFSLRQLGRWPWPREHHAQLIDRLTPAKPLAVGLDVILVEPGSGDEALRAALARSGVTVLPVVAINPGTGLTAGLPAGSLAKAGTALGHINLEHDSDGVVRSVFLHERLNGRWWPHFALVLAGFARVSANAPPVPFVSVPTATGETWQRANPLRIPFAGSGQFQSVPYVSVLRGEVAPEFFTGKIVLVGATALGLSDSYPTPVSARVGAMPGVEIHANVLASLLNQRAIRIVPHWLTGLLSTIPVALAMLGYLLFSPRLALFITATLLGLMFLASYIGLANGIWLAPSAASIVLVLAYPLWSWRRLEAAITYLGQEFLRLDREPHLLPEVSDNRAPDSIADVLERRIDAMKNAARRVRDLRKFVSNSLDNLPDATLVADVNGRVLLANREANLYFEIADDNEHSGLIGVCVLELLTRLQAPQPIDSPANTQFAWCSLIDLDQIDILANGVSATDLQQRDLLVKSAPCFSIAHQLTGWIVSLTDISTIRAAERSRDETLRFLSHDMRAPQASILALLELQGEPDSALPPEEFFARIEKASRKTLGLADNFVQLARAESHEYRLQEVDFRDLLFDATDEMWSLAKGKQIDIVTEIDNSTDYTVMVDRALMTRALTNLLSNAINYSPPKARIVCSISLSFDIVESKQPSRVACRICDAGYGIALEDQQKLFRRFARVDLPDQPRHDGIGLGLVFVKTVVERHAGEISFVSAPAVGTCFTLQLPRHDSFLN